MHTRSILQLPRARKRTSTRVWLIPTTLAGMCGSACLIIVLLPEARRVGRGPAPRPGRRRYYASSPEGPPRRAPPARAGVGQAPGRLPPDACPLGQCEIRRRRTGVRGQHLPAHPLRRGARAQGGRGPRERVRHLQCTCPHTQTNADGECAGTALTSAESCIARWRRAAPSTCSFALRTPAACRVRVYPSARCRARGASLSCAAARTAARDSSETKATPVRR